MTGNFARGTRCGVRDDRRRGPVVDDARRRQLGGLAPARPDQRGAGGTGLAGLDGGAGLAAGAGPATWPLWGLGQHGDASHGEQDESGCVDDEPAHEVSGSELYDRRPVPWHGLEDVLRGRQS